jgi:hypothetical protein
MRALRADLQKTPGEAYAQVNSKNRNATFRLTNPDELDLRDRAGAAD